MEPLALPPPPSPAPPTTTPHPPPRSAAVSHQIRSPTTGSPSPNPSLNPPPSGGARAAPEALRTAVPPLRSVVVGSIRIQLEEDSAHARTSSSRRVSFSSGYRVSLPPHRRHYSPPPKRHNPRPCCRSATTAAPGSGSAIKSASAISGTNIDELVPSQCRRDTTANCSDGLDEKGWSTVRPKYWWRRGEFTPHRRRPTPYAHQLPMAKTLQGKCLRCLGKGHSAASCREPVRCINCGRFGHKAQTCRSPTLRRAQHYRPLPPNNRPPKPSPTPPPPPRQAPARSHGAAGRPGVPPPGDIDGGSDKRDHG